MKNGFPIGKFSVDKIHKSLPSLLLAQVATGITLEGDDSRLLDICLTNSAIFIAPDYRLLPEASAIEVVEDVEDFWIWLHSTLPALTATWDAVPDLNRIACTGQSAGGYLAVQSALLFPELARIKVVASMGGSLNTDVPSCRIPGPRIILGKRPPPPGKAENIIRTYMKNIKPQTVRTSGDVLEMWDFVTCVVQQAYLARWIGRAGRDDLDIMKGLRGIKKMPPSKSTPTPKSIQHAMCD